jgi:hypothetical protein
MRVEKWAEQAVTAGSDLGSERRQKEGGRSGNVRSVVERETAKVHGDRSVDAVKR